MNTILKFTRRTLISLGFVLLVGVFSENSPAMAATGISSVQKYALLIGNSNYSGNRRSLKNPENDVKLIGKNLAKLGFAVKQLSDLDRNQMMKAVSEFSDELPVGSTSFVFYAGHGMQIGGASYLVPVDMVVTSEQSVPLRAYPLKTLLERVSSSKAAVNIVVLDACRDNPFRPTGAATYRNFGNLGLAPVQAPRGTMIAYSTAPGQLAADGKEGNSAYAAALAETIVEPQLSLEAIFKKVGTRVRKKTQDDQIPWYETSLEQEYFFLPPDGLSVVAGYRTRSGDEARNESGNKRGVDKARGKNFDSDLWFRTMSEYEWSRLDYDITQRVKFMTQDEVPLMEHRAKGGNVVAQTTLGLFWLSGSTRAVNPSTGQVMRYQPNNTKAVRWLRQAAVAGFPIAQTELGEMLHRGKGIDRDSGQARQLLESAAQAKYPRAKLDLLQIDLEEGKAGGTDLNALMESVTRAMVPPGYAR